MLHLDKWFTDKVSQNLIDAVEKDSLIDVGHILVMDRVSNRARDYALWVASMQGKDDIRVLIRDMGGSPYAELNGMLSNAARRGDIDGINDTLREGAHLFHESHYPLRIAILSNQLEAAQYLHELGCRLHYAINKNDLTELWATRDVRMHKTLLWVAQTQNTEDLTMPYDFFNM